MQVRQTGRGYSKRPLNIQHDKYINPNALVFRSLHTQQVLSFAINRDVWQANQQEIVIANTKNISWLQVLYIRNRPGPTPSPLMQQQATLAKPTTGKFEPCYKCGQPFIKNHLDMCTAQNFTCRKCTKISHFISMCKASIPKGENPQLQTGH